MSDRSLNIRIPEKLRESIKEYASKRGTTVTQLTLDYYRRLVELDHRQEAEQI